MICDKPMTMSFENAIDVVNGARDGSIGFCFNQNYSVYSMVRQVLAMVADSKIWEFLQVNIEFSQGKLSTNLEPDAQRRL